MRRTTRWTMHKRPSRRWRENRSCYPRRRRS